MQYPKHVEKPLAMLGMASSRAFHTRVANSPGTRRVLYTRKKHVVSSQWRLRVYDLSSFTLSMSTLSERTDGKNGNRLL